MAKKENNEAVVAADVTQDSVEVSSEPIDQVDEVELEGFEGMERTYSTLPYLTIVQATNEDIGVIDGCKPGAFITTVTKDILSAPLELVIYKMWRSRSLMPPREEGTFPICSSVDGVVGSKHGNCAECDLQGFKDGSCRSQMSFIVAPRSNPSKLMRLTLWKTSAKTGNEMARILTTVAREKQAPIYAISIKLESESAKSKQGGTYYKFVASMGAVIAGPEERAAIRPNYMDAKGIYDKHKESFSAMLAANKAEAADAEEDDFQQGIMTGADEAAAIENPLM